MDAQNFIKLSFAELKSRIGFIHMEGYIFSLCIIYGAKTNTAYDKEAVQCFSGNISDLSQVGAV